ncbi:MAG: STAS domain-containing protein [Sporichthyaceae bacterium]|nr:STAS domain-containing protein [Sporichthyaceae bacterium]
MLDVRRDADADGRSVVLVSGQVDLATAPHLTRSLSEAIGAGATEITVDLTGVDFLDSTGIRALVQGARAAKQANATLYIRGARGWVARVLELTGGRPVSSSPGRAASWRSRCELRLATAQQSTQRRLTPRRRV